MKVIPMRVGSENYSQVPIEREVLARLLMDFGGDEQSLIELVQVYLDDAPRLLDAMRAALRCGDSAALRVAAHTLKGISATMGAMTLSAQCNKLEALLSTPRLAEAEELVMRLDQEFARVQTQLTADYCGEGGERGAL